MPLVLCDPSDHLLHLHPERLVQSVTTSHRHHRKLRRLERGALKAKRSSKLLLTRLASGYEPSPLGE